MNVAIRAAPATARSMAWAPLAVASGTVAGLVVARPWDGPQMGLGLGRLALVLVAIGAALALDDAAEITLACSPTSLLRRRAIRLAATTAAAAAITVVAVFAAGAGGGTEGVPLDRLVLEGAGILLLAMALSTALDGGRGAFALAGGLLGAVVVQQRWPAWSLFPMAPGAPGWSRAAFIWGVLAAISAGALFVILRDPCLRTPRQLIAAIAHERSLRLAAAKRRFFHR